MPEQFTQLVEIQTAEGLTTIRLDGATAEILVGENGAPGLVSVRNANGEERVRLESRGVTVMDENGTAVVQLIGAGRQMCIPRNIVTQPSVNRARGNCQTCSSIYSKGMVERASRRADRLVGEHADKTPALAC
jgi:hypothetical protein